MPILTPYIKMHYLEKWWKEKSPLNLDKTLVQEAKDAFIHKVWHESSIQTQIFALQL
jgi:hypothetical protein